MDPPVWEIQSFHRLYHIFLPLFFLYIYVESRTMELSEEAKRFLPLVKTVATQTQRDLTPDLDHEFLIECGSKGLSDGIKQYKSRQGLTRRIYLTYRIKSAIYDGLSNHPWQTTGLRKQYLFFKKANELLLNFHLSAEGTVKRSIAAEEEEISDVLGMMAISALLVGGDIVDPKLNHCIRRLDRTEQEFLQQYYFQDEALSTVCAKMKSPSSAVFRFHLKILGKLSDCLTTENF
jgi:DNA-directed RNA polymerase specialized sigma subunit